MVGGDKNHDHLFPLILVNQVSVHVLNWFNQNQHDQWHVRHTVSTLTSWTDMLPLKCHIFMLYLYFIFILWYPKHSFYKMSFWVTTAAQVKRESLFCIYWQANQYGERWIHVFLWGISANQHPYTHNRWHGLWDNSANQHPYIDNRQDGVDGRSWPISLHTLTIDRTEQMGHRGQSASIFSQQMGWTQGHIGQSAFHTLTIDGIDQDTSAIHHLCIHNRWH